MAYSQSRKLSAEEKKLQALRTQLYGKDRPLESVKETSDNSAFSFKSQQKAVGLPTIISAHETSYLKKDLIKIGILATLVFAIQALLFIGISRGIINI